MTQLKLFDTFTFYLLITSSRW